jgi:hypothetical protein
MLISSTLSKGERIYRSSNRRKSLVSIPRRPRNSSRRKMQRMVEYCVRFDARFWYHGRLGHRRLDLDKAQLSQPGNSYHRHPVESIPFEGSSSFQGLRESTWGLGPALSYHVILATCLQVQLARQYTTLMLQPSYPVYQLSQPRPSACTKESTQRSSCHMTNHMHHSPFLPLAHSHDRLYMPYIA